MFLLLTPKQEATLSVTEIQNSKTSSQQMSQHRHQRASSVPQLAHSPLQCKTHCRLCWWALELSPAWWALVVLSGACSSCVFFLFFLHPGDLRRLCRQFCSVWPLKSKNTAASRSLVLSAAALLIGLFAVNWGHVVASLSDLLMIFFFFFFWLRHSRSQYHYKRLLKLAKLSSNASCRYLLRTWLVQSVLYLQLLVLEWPMSGNGDGSASHCVVHGGMVLIGSRRLSWFPTSLCWDTGELDSFRLSREPVHSGPAEWWSPGNNVTVFCFLFQIALCHFDWVFTGFFAPCFKSHLISDQ